MVTVTFQIKPYLAAYMYMRYKNHLDVPPDRSSSSLSAIHLLDTQPIYHFLHQLSIPHPPNASWHETGNITFTLPHPRNGKNPNVYNYIGHNSALIIEKAMEVEMRAELYEFLLENKYCHGIMFKKSMETFVEHYNMVGLVKEESLMRAFQRWRKMNMNVDVPVFSSEKRKMGKNCIIFNATSVNTDYENKYRYCLRALLKYCGY